MQDFSYLFSRLDKSRFRSHFHLGDKERKYYFEKGDATIERHARDFISARLAPAKIANDGKQTPMRGHPVFIAQHATATCCRSCLFKWHHIPQNRDLTEREIDYIVSVIMSWLQKETKTGK